MRKKLLFIAVYPFPLNMGSKQHAYYFLKALSRLCEVYCIFFIPPGMPAPSQEELNAIDLDLKGIKLCFFKTSKIRHNQLQYIINLVSFPNRFSKLATHEAGYKAIISSINKWAIDIVHVEHFWFAPYLFKLGNRLKKVIVYHDLHHDVFRKQLKLENKPTVKLQLFLEMLKIRLFEKFLDHFVTLKIFLNPDEMKLLPQKAIHIPHIVNSEIVYNCARDTEFFNLLFIGSYHHAPNRSSMEFIINQILPELIVIKPSFRLHVVGPGTENFSSIIDSSNIKKYVHIHGFQEDINNAFKDMDLALFPIAYGGGVKTKVIDAMAAGIPVVTTSEGLTGMINLPDNCIAVGDTPDDVLKEILLLMNGFTIRQDRSRIGREYILREHSFEAFSQKVAKTYLNNL